MRFGSRSHDTNPDEHDRPVNHERARLVASLRELAAKIEGAPLTRITASIPALTAALEPMARLVDRALARPAGK